MTYENRLERHSKILNHITDEWIVQILYAFAVNAGTKAIYHVFNDDVCHSMIVTRPKDRSGKLTGCIQCNKHIDKVTGYVHYEKHKFQINMHNKTIYAI